MIFSSPILIIASLGLLLIIALLMVFYLKKNRRDLEKLKAELREDEKEES